MSTEADLSKLRAMNEHYHSLGLLTGVFGLSDKPGETEPMHAHGAARIFIIAGSVELELEGEPVVHVSAGEEIVIQEQQGHQVTIGPEGWLYLFACDAGEADAQGITRRVS